MKIFVSYSSKDREFVTRLATDLRNRGLDVWLDVWNITGRDPYWQEIEKAIEQATHVLFVISPDSIEEGCAARDELGHAKHHKKKIVVVMARPVPYDELPIEITPGRYQIHDFTTLAYADGLHSTLGALLGSHEMPTRQTPIPFQSQKNERNWLMIVGVATLVVFAGLIALNALLAGDSDDSRATDIADLGGLRTDTPDITITPTLETTATDAAGTSTQNAIVAITQTVQVQSQTPPTDTPTNTFTPTNTSTLPSIATQPQISGFPCTVTVKEDDTVFYSDTNSSSAVGEFDAGAEISVQREEAVSRQVVYYEFEFGRSQQTRYILKSDVEPSASCP